MSCTNGSRDYCLTSSTDVNYLSIVKYLIMQKNVSTQTKNNFVTRRVPMCLEVAQGKLMYIYILDI